MENFDYEKIGLKAGLEIHQQLNTRKLFCSCPSILRNDEPLKIVERRLNPVIGETGVVDVAAEFEKSKNRIFKYHFFDTNCLVELDEEPPHEINKEALKIAIQISLLLNCKIFPVTQVMRKIVIDGSNTSGFQRTLLVGYDGYVETDSGKVKIDYVFLEEDSARPLVEDEESSVKVYKLDRLGIPLVEIATGAHMHTPEQIKEVALKIGEILRACNVRRGIGTIRQDLNISIKGSKRVEIKGFQDPRIMIKTINEEIKRQMSCLERNACVSEVRMALPDGSTKFLRPMPGAARMYPETDLPLIKIQREFLDEIKKSLPKLADENKRYLKECGLNDELIKLILKKNLLEDFKVLSKVFNNPDLIAKSLTIFRSEISKKTGIDEKKVEEILNVHVIEAILEKVGTDISGGDVKNIMQGIVEGKSIEEAVSQKQKINISEEIRNLLRQKKGLSKGAYMGLIMGKFKGQVSGKEVSDELDKIMSETN